LLCGIDVPIGSRDLPGERGKLLAAGRRLATSTASALCLTAAILS